MKLLIRKIDKHITDQVWDYVKNQNHEQIWMLVDEKITDEVYYQTFTQVAMQIHKAIRIPDETA